MEASVNIPEFYLDHETRIRMLENLAKDTMSKLDRMEDKLESRFTLLIGLIVTSIIVPVVLHTLKLV